MVAAARAIGASPRILLMDEPTAALGVREASAFLDLIQDLKGRHISIVLVTHRLPDLFAVGDRILVLKAGQVQGVLSTGESDIDSVVALIVKGRERQVRGEVTSGA
jgi:ABC-type sugar transport system ATPase subunit